MSEYVPTTEAVRSSFASNQFVQRGEFEFELLAEDEAGVAFDAWLAAHDAEVAAKARGEALIEAVQAHRNLHKTYGSTSVCRGGIGGQVMTPHCGAICYNHDAHQEEVDAWHVIEAEAVEFAAEYRKAVQDG